MDVQHGAAVRGRGLARELELERKRAGGVRRGQQGLALEGESTRGLGLCQDD